MFRYHPWGVMTRGGVGRTIRIVNLRELEERARAAGHEPEWDLFREERVTIGHCRICRQTIGRHGDHVQIPALCVARNSRIEPPR
jgi:hypothetical protein